MFELNKNEKFLAWICLFSVIFFVIASRRPDIIFNAQPWAEDGKIWIENIYNNGFWSSILLPQNGYYQTISRLTYGFALIFGISKAALISNIIAISIRCFFVMFILSERMSFINIQYRIAAVIYFLLMPNLSEGYVNITNIHWYLSLYLMAILISDDAHSKSWKVHDFSILIISSLSGPFVVFITPCLILKRVSQRGGVIKAIIGINSFDVVMAFCFLIQVVAIIVSSDSGRSAAPLGAGFTLLASIIAYRVMGGSFFPNEYIHPMVQYATINVAAFVLLILVLIYLFIKSDWRIKSAIVFPVLMIGFALAKPMMSLDQPQWPTFLIPGGGERYFFITNFSFYCLLLCVINRFWKNSNLPLMLMVVVTMPLMIRGYIMLPMAEVGYKDDVITFSKMKAGESMHIHINPPGWEMNLLKK